MQALPRGTRWLVHSDVDADGLASAAVAAAALHRMGHRFHIHTSRDKTSRVYTDLFQREADGYLVTDKGTSHLDVLSKGARRTGKPVLVIDHHNVVHDPLPEEVGLLNPRTVGLDGSRDACSSTAAVAFALALHGEGALDLVPTALVGAIGDWQHMGGWQGWNQHLVDAAREAGHLPTAVRPALIGTDLADALSRDHGPGLPGLAGDPGTARRFLADLEIPNVGDVDALSDDERTHLLSGLVLHGLSHGVPPADLDLLRHETAIHPRLGVGLRSAFRVVDACGREDRPDVGIAYLLGDRSARQEAQAVYDRYRTTLTEALDRLRETGPVPHKAFQHFTVERAAYTGMVGGLGMTHVVTDKARPICVTAPRDDGDVQVSTRGTHEQVEAGLDLGTACRVAGAGVDREGGGHPIAAGVVVAPQDLERFLGELDDALAMQGFLGRAK